MMSRLESFSFPFLFVRFLLLMTQGLYGALEEATRSEQANKEIAQIVVEQFGSQNTLTGVAQGVVDRVVRIHHDTFMQVNIPPGEVFTTIPIRRKITFSYPSPGSISHDLPATG